MNRLNDHLVNMLFAEPKGGKVFPRISSTLYTILFVIAIWGAIFTFFKFRIDRALEIYDPLSVVLAIAIILHWIMIYVDIRLLENPTPSVQSDYSKWMNIPLERGLRWSIVILMLFGAGKIAEAFMPIAKSIQRPEIKEIIVNFLDPETRKDLSSSLLVIGSIWLYSCLVLWNAFAAYFRIKNRKLIADYRPEVTFRIILFSVLSAVCLLYWAHLYGGFHLNSSRLNIFAGAYAVLMAVVLLLKSERLCKAIFGK